MTEVAVVDLIETPVAVARHRGVRLQYQVVGWILFVAVVAGALIAGFHLRKWAWDQTEPIRYTTDINNAFQQGTVALRIGYIDRYDEQVTRPNHETFMDLDYAPGRLAIATLWTRWATEQLDLATKNNKKIPRWSFRQPFYTRARQLNLQYELVKPLLMVNLTGEILSTIAMFFLVRRYTAGRPPNLRLVRGHVLGLIAALFFWFNPALIWNAHCWPQWDSWVLPFFLWGVVLASWDWWFAAGFVVATGAMFKGQILFGAPIFLLWPLFQGRLTALLRWIIGLCSSTAVITAVWLVRTPGTTPTGKAFIPGSINEHAIEWLIYLGLIFVALTCILRWRRRSVSHIPAAILLAAIVAWIIATHTNHLFNIPGFVGLAVLAWFVDDRFAKWSWHARLPLIWLVVAILVYPIYILAKDWLAFVFIATIAMAMLLATAPRKVVPYAAAGWMAGALLLCMPIFGASRGWFDLGFAYGTHHFERMANGPVNNLPELLQQGWGWDNLMDPAFTLPKGPFADHIATFLSAVDPGVRLQPGKEIGLPLKYVLVCLWLMAVLACAAAAAIHDRNRSPRFLAAIVAPWIVFFAVMTQMHQRYLLWGASLSAATAVLSPGYALLHLFLSMVSMSQEMQSMMHNPWEPTDHGQNMNNAIYRFIENWHPGIAWAVLLTAGIFVYSAVRWDYRQTTK